MKTLTQFWCDLSAALWVAKYVIYDLLKFPAWQQLLKREYTSSVIMIFIVVLIAGKKNTIFAVLKSMMHSSPYIVKKTAGFFSARVTAAVCSVKERDGCLDHVALSSVPH